MQTRRRVFKIAMLSHEPFFPPSGGGSTEAIYLAREFEARGHILDIFCPEIPDRHRIESEFNIRIVPFKKWQMSRTARLRNLKYVVYPFFLSNQVLQEFTAKRYDVILSMHTISAIAAGIVRRKIGVVTIMNFLDLLFGFTEVWKPKYLYKLIAPGLVKFELNIPVRAGAEYVFTVSDVLKEKFVQAGFSSERISSIYFGFDSELFKPLGFATRPGQERPVIVMHGSFDEHHLGSIAFECITTLAKRNPQFTFRFIGPCTKALQRLLLKTRATVPNIQIETTGFVPYQKVAEILKDATVGIVPYEESSGAHCAFVAKIVEYAGMALPVASTPLAGIKRWFNNCPTVKFADSFNGKALADCVLELLRMPRDKVIQESMSLAIRVKEKLDWRVISRNAVDLVENCVAKLKL